MTSSPTPTSSPFSRLALVGLVGSIAVVPYQVALLAQMPSAWEGPADAATLATGAGLAWLLVIVPAILLGLKLGPAIGLARILPPRSDDAASASAGMNPLLWSALAGLVAGAVLLVVAMVSPESLFGEPPDVEHPGFVAGLLASFGAGTTEEIMMRFGLMTLLAWIGCKLAGESPVTDAVAWTANALAALGFALLHVPQMIMLGGTSAGAIAFVILGNGSVGMLFGWLYWRRGLVAAMVAHFTTDIVLHVIGPWLDGLIGKGA